MFPVQAFVEMISDEVERLRNPGPQSIGDFADDHGELPNRDYRG